MSRSHDSRLAADMFACLMTRPSLWVRKTLARSGGISRRSVWRIAPTLLLLAVNLGCPTPTPDPKPGSWLVFLCQASDAPQQPHAITFYRELFDSNQRDLLFDYFQKMSNSRVDISGTEIYGWFKMTVDTATIAPAARNNTTQPNRSQTAQDCRSAGVASFLASGKTINPDKYAGFIAVINVPVDAGATGKSIVGNDYQHTSFYAHEMLHIYGLGHSNIMEKDLSPDHTWNQGVDRDYGDCWDIMSFETCTYGFNTPNHNLQGPELHMAYREKLGWLAAPRIFAKNAADPSPSTVTMAPVSEPHRPGPLMARIEVPGGATYAAEYRVPTGFDRAIPRGAVVIRELRSNGKSYLPTRQNGSIGWTQGEQFTDSAHFLGITVDAVTPESATITINPRLSTVANLGDICGNKYVGAVRGCPSGAVCQARRSGSLITIDYFCTR